ncbi:hypothetical protein GUITHDRAFT_133362 [Guillardia theta CCMP2712]|uniref:SPARK domain-containing protein n=1 Tax=Guillardia theta (strain CCMP2712) TaxID=905079 RepID=L1JX95_GUITC|nr:hypothetical protein GUITHDRAFT_133362 [Guillardia theta CCMP2712]EKX52959.1 hypothetical protein GUITHDRAFT_133362 [Guillardia theta CCMP2712]|eukprot:XP_005839939.1 hypothetical protein GUITHDRAFT_133362 [Guillardia theta CCMP2712]
MHTATHVLRALLLGLCLTMAQAKLSSPAAAVVSKDMHHQPGRMNAHDLSVFVKQTLQAQLKGVKKVVRGRMTASHSSHIQHHAASLRSTGESDSMSNMTDCEKAITIALSTELAHCISFLDDNSTVVPNATVLDGVCAPPNGCLSLLHNFSLPNSMNASCPANMTSESIMQTPIAMAIQQAMSLLCLKSNGVYCTLQMYELMSASQTGQMDFNLPLLCSSSCFNSMITMMMSTPGLGQSSDDSSPQLLQLAFSTMCMQDSKGDYCLSKMMSDDINTAFLCTECGAKILSSPFIQESFSSVISDPTELAKFNSMMKALCMKDGTQFCLEKQDALNQIMDSGPQAISQAKTMGCCVGSLLQTEPAIEGPVLAIAKACGLTVPSPCQAGPRFTFTVDVSNLKNSWYAANTQLVDTYLIQDLASGLSVYTNMVQKKSSSSTSNGGTQFGMQIDTISKDQGTLVYDKLKAMQMRRAQGLQLTQLASKLPDTAKVDPSLPLSLTVRAGSIEQTEVGGVPAVPQTTPLTGGSSCLTPSIILHLLGAFMAFTWGLRRA